MKPTSYRIKRTKLLDYTYGDGNGDGNEQGHVSYLEEFNSGGRKYNFSQTPCICPWCLDHHGAIDFKTASEAKKKLRTSAVKEYFADERSSIHAAYKIEVVGLHFEVCDESNSPRIESYGIKFKIPGGHHVVTKERVIWPLPPVLDRLAAL